ncbi:MAG: MarR family winged helix-turn-helix transcriptional regulator [Robiginitomaculum sp.]
MAIARRVDRRLFFIFDRAHGRLSKLADKRLAKTAGIKTAQAAALAYLGYHDECTLSELAAGVGHNNSAITGLVDRMSAAGLVERIRVLSDGRAKKVRLTAKGWSKREIVMGEFRGFNEKLVKGFSESEIDIIYKFLSEAVDNVED